MIARRRGFSLIELVLVAFLLGFVLLIFFYLFKTGLIASSKGQSAAQVRETAKLALDRMATELRQAIPIPGGSDIPPPAVILPGPGGTLTSIEQSSVGCSIVAGCVTSNASVLNSSVTVPTPSISQVAGGPSGFLIFSELRQIASPGGSLYTPSDPNYALKLANYVWVMYQVNPAGQLLRYTFNVLGNGTDITQVPGGWIRNNAYFVPANSIETASGVLPLVIASVQSLVNVNGAMWAMASHPPSSAALLSSTGMTYDPQLFVLTCIVQGGSLSNMYTKGLSMDSATLSSQVKVEGGGQ